MEQFKWSLVHYPNGLYIMIRSMKPSPRENNGRKYAERLFLVFKVQITEKYRYYKTLMTIISRYV